MTSSNTGAVSALVLPSLPVTQRSASPYTLEPLCAGIMLCSWSGALYPALWESAIASEAFSAGMHHASVLVMYMRECMLVNMWNFAVRGRENGRSSLIDLPTICIVRPEDLAHARPFVQARCAAGRYAAVYGTFRPALEDAVNVHRARKAERLLVRPVPASSPPGLKPSSC